MQSWRYPMNASLDLQPCRRRLSDEPSTYFRKGFGLKAAVQEDLSADYTVRIVDLLRSQAYTLVVDNVTVRLAREFGFCYGWSGRSNTRTRRAGSFRIGGSFSLARSSTTPTSTRACVSSGGDPRAS
jgi:hypothetical protein